MKVIVITGSTRGIGYGLAEALIERGCAVVVSSRGNETVKEAVRMLSAQDQPGEAFGQACDVRSGESLQALWDQTTANYGQVDIWINNAGVTCPPREVWKVASQEIQSIIDTNILGSILGTKIAVHGMLEQGHGAIYLMEGMGSGGRTHAGLTLYGMTKYALDYFFKGIAEELDGTNILAGAIRPGMVVTDLITRPYHGKPEEWARVKPIFNIIADPVDQVTDWMADAILENNQNGKTLNRISRLAMTLRFLKAPFVKRELFADVDLT